MHKNVFRFCIVSVVLFHQMLLGTGFTHADSRQWSYYGSDDFENDTLRALWHVPDTEVRLVAGKIHLTNPSDVQGLLVLKGLYQVSEPRIYLYWPWAMETEMCAPAGVESFNGGITLKFGVDAREREGVFQGNQSTTASGGWSFRLDAGQEVIRGKASVYYAVDGDKTSDWAGPRFHQADRLFLRVEGVGDDRRTVRVGVKLRDTDDWSWSPPVVLARPVKYAEPMALYNGPLRGDAVDGDRLTVAFESVRFEGNSFDPGVFHRDGSPYLRSLTDTQKQQLRGAGRSVQYVRQNVPEVAESLPRGQRYQAQVPDTLDLAARMELSINAITECVDRDADFEAYSHVFANPRGWTRASVQYNPDMERGGPVFLHDIHGYNTSIGEPWVESLPLLRSATGNKRNLDVSQHMFDNLRRMIGDDGLPYVPLEGRPWACFTGWWVHDPLTGHSLDTDLSMTGQGGWGRYLSTLAVWYMATANPFLEREIQLMVGAFDRLHSEHPQRPHGMSREYGLVQAYRATGYEPARKLATRLLAKTRARQFQSNGSFSGHFHGTTMKLLAMAELGALTNDQELLDFVRRSYEFARAKGVPRIGFYPEGIDQNPPVCESCSFTHLPKIASVLSLAGKGDYWDDIDSLVRNQMVENQLTECQWIDELSQSIPCQRLPSPPGYDGTRDVGRRLLGGFASYASFNDYFQLMIHAPGPIVGCCTGNGARALYDVWENILHVNNERLYVNLLLNRASEWADIDSYIPYEGRVDVLMKASLPLYIRIPGWADEEQVSCTVGGEPQSLEKWGRYASPGLVDGGKTATFRFPIEEQTVRLTFGPVEGKFTFRGSTVVEVSPPGTTRPLYQDRQHYRSGKVRFKMVERFAPDISKD